MTAGGDTTSLNVSFDGDLHDSLVVDSVMIDVGACDPVGIGNLIHCVIGDMAAGAVATITSV